MRRLATKDERSAIDHGWLLIPMVGIEEPGDLAKELALGALALAVLCGVLAIGYESSILWWVAGAAALCSVGLFRWGLARTQQDWRSILAESVQVDGFKLDERGLHYGQLAGDNESSSTPCSPAPATGRRRQAWTGRAGAASYGTTSKTTASVRPMPKDAPGSRDQNWAWMRSPGCMPWALM